MESKPRKKDTYNFVVAETGKLDSHVKLLDGKVNDTNIIIIGIVMVLFLGFIALLATVIGSVSDAYNFKSSNYVELVKQVTVMNMQIHNLSNQQGQIEINDINQKIEDLKKKNPYLK